jgi:hypothetical protein
MGGIDSVISGSLLIDYQFSSDAGKEDGNNNSTPGIHRPTNNDKILIEEKAVDACLGFCPEKTGSFYQQRQGQQ